ncbi:MAG TPA: hypothetical protein VFW71_06085 [Actinomycetota bacterium]|nr:hypothetical protein [Actinomycetota bacterium]
MYQRRVEGGTNPWGPVPLPPDPYWKPSLAAQRISGIWDLPTLLHLQRSAGNSSVLNALGMGGSRPAVQPGQGRTVQRAIATTARQVSLTDNNVMDGKAITSPTVDMGTTTQPAGAVAPQYQVDPVPFKTHKGQRFRAKLRLTQKADEGTVDSIYTAPGTYYTHYRWKPESAIRELYRGQEHRMHPSELEAKNRKINPATEADAVNWEYLYVNVSRAIALQSKAAEHEHLSDIREAYRLTLAAAEQAVRAVIASMPLDGFGGVSGYRTWEAALSDVATRILHQLPQERRPLGTDQNQWLGRYLSLAKMTQDRDAKFWHYFDLRSSGFMYNNRLLKSVTETWDIYAEHPETMIHYADVIVGNQLQVGRHPSSSVVHL